MNPGRVVAAAALYAARPNRKRSSMLLAEEAVAVLVWMASDWFPFLLLRVCGLLLAAIDDSKQQRQHRMHAFPYRLKSHFAASHPSIDLLIITTGPAHSPAAAAAAVGLLLLLVAAGCKPHGVSSRAASLLSIPAAIMVPLV